MRSRDRNLAWSCDETILLLDLYLRHPSTEARHPKVAALSATLRDLVRATGAPRPENFRNPVGIAMKPPHEANGAYSVAGPPARPDPKSGRRKS